MIVEGKVGLALKASETVAFGGDVVDSPLDRDTFQGEMKPRLGHSAVCRKASANWPSDTVTVAVALCIEPAKYPAVRLTATRATIATAMTAPLMVEA